VDLVLVRSALRGVAAALVVAAPLVQLAAPPARADMSVTIDEGTAFVRSQTITVRYNGVARMERIFVQQCWDGPSPTFDYSISCEPDTMIFPGLASGAEAAVKFELFVGDNPHGSFPVACGPKTDPSYDQHDTCYIRVVTAARERNDLAVFVPITFAGATPAASSTSIPAAPPTSIAAAGPTSSATTIAAATVTTTGSSATSGPTMSAVVVTQRRGPGLGTYVVGALGITGVVAIVLRARSQRRRSPSSVRSPTTPR
jgi:hypothetical protein